MAHPHCTAIFHITENRGVFFLNHQLRFAVLVVIGCYNHTAEVLGDQLHAVANTQYRQSKLKNSRIGMVRIIGVNGSRSAAKDDSFRLFRFDIFYFFIVGDDFAVYAVFSEASGDELCVL